MVIINMDYIDLGYKPRKKDVVCEFRVEPEKGNSVRETARQVAAESSVGTWTRVHTEKTYMKKLTPKIFHIRGNTVRIAYDISLFEKGNVPQILSSVAGNIFGMKMVRNLRLFDITLPEELIGSFPGPRHGIKGVRDTLKVRERPLVGTIIKPKLGLRTRDHARVAYEAWAGGCDIVKDDENLTSQDFNPFEDRVADTLNMRDKAEYETGEKKVYMPNITAETGEMLERLDYVKSHGGRYVMVDVLTCGFSGLQSVRKNSRGMIIHGHRAMHAAMTRNQKHGISMLVLAKLCRLVGVDQLHIGTVVGKMEGTREEIENLEEDVEERFIKKDPGEHLLEQKWGGLKPVFAVCSGGLHPGHVPKLMEYMGRNIIIQMGGGIHGHPDGTAAGAKASRQAVDATMKGKTLAQYSRTHPELAKAIKRWKF
jgi:ribulose-bisphosphate carboxylase large chain